MAKGMIGAVAIAVALLAMWSYFAVDAFLEWEEKASGTVAPAGREYSATATEFVEYMAGKHSLQDDLGMRWEGEYDKLDEARLSLAGLAVLIPTVFFLMIKGGGLTFSIAVTSGVNFFCGLAHLLVVAGQLLGLALAFVEAGSLAYDFSIYSLLLYCTISAILAAICTRSSFGLVRGEAPAWKSSLWSSAALIALNVPLLPIFNLPRFSVDALAGIFLPACIAAANLLVLGMTSANFSFDRAD